MASDTKDILMKQGKTLFAKVGYDGFSIRILAEESGVGISSIYHFFNDKDLLLKEIFDQTVKELGRLRAQRDEKTSASAMLYDRIFFQFEHIEDVVFILKYYLHFRGNYEKNKYGYIPTTAYTHIKEVLEAGISSGEFSISEEDINEEAKVVTHAINGFLLEYFPRPPMGAERDELVQSIHRFIVRSLKYKEGEM